MIKSLLLALDGSDASESAQCVAIAVAMRCGAELVGMGVLDTPTITAPTMTPVGGAAFKARRDEALIDDANKRIAAFLGGFEAACKRAGVRCSTVEAEGIPADQFARELHRHDLLAIGRDTNFHFETTNDTGETVGRLLRDSPRPIMVVPSDPPPGDAVVVAYDGSIQACRSVQMYALLGLPDAAKVHVVSVSADLNEAEAQCADAEVYLARHGLTVQTHAVASTHGPAEAIQAKAEEVGARAVVMGAFGEAGLTEFFLGSCTKRLLKHCPVPMFIYH